MLISIKINTSLSKEITFGRGLSLSSVTRLSIKSIAHGHFGSGRSTGFGIGLNGPNFAYTPGVDTALKEAGGGIDVLGRLLLSLNLLDDLLLMGVEIAVADVCGYGLGLVAIGGVFYLSEAVVVFAVLVVHLHSIQFGHLPVGAVLEALLVHLIILIIYRSLSFQERVDVHVVGLLLHLRLELLLRHRLLLLGHFLLELQEVILELILIDIHVIVPIHHLIHVVGLVLHVHHLVLHVHHLVHVHIVYCIFLLIYCMLHLLVLYSLACTIYLWPCAFQTLKAACWRMFCWPFRDCTCFYIAFFFLRVMRHLFLYIYLADPFDYFDFWRQLLASLSSTSIFFQRSLTLSSI